MHLKIRNEVFFMKTGGRLQKSFPAGLRYANHKQVQSLSKVTKCFNGGNIIIFLLGAMAEPTKTGISGKTYHVTPSNLWV